MNKLMPLLSVEVRSLFGINKFLYTKDKKEKSRGRMLLAAWVILGAMGVSYVSALVAGLCTLGISAVVPAYLAVISSALIIMFGIFTAGNRIFSPRTYGILASMPISKNAIVCARFLGMYISDLALTLFIMIPGALTYGMHIHPSASFYIYTFIGSLFIPAIPLVISTLVGTVVLAISSRMKKKSMAQTVLMVVFVLGTMLLSFSAGAASESLTAEDFMKLAETVEGIFSRIYPPAVWFGSAAMGGDILGFMLFAAVSAASAAAIVAVTSRFFTDIVVRMGSHSAKHDYKLGEMGSRGILKALYVREAKRYFSSSVYVTNTIIGPIMGLIMSVAVCVTGIEALSVGMPFDIVPVLPFAYAAITCMMTTTSVSISMEGREIPIIKSLPIPAKALFDSKILLNLSLIAPSYLVAAVCLAVATKPDFLGMLAIIAVPISVALFSVVFGITVNLKLHSFDWTNEAVVVKQSAAAAIGGFAGFFAGAVCGVAVILAPAAYTDTVRFSLCAVLLALTFMLYRSNNRKKLVNL